MFLTINISAKANLTPRYWQVLTTMLASPSNISYHKALALAYKSEGRNELAKKELVYAGTVLGISTQEEAKLEDETNIIESKYWQWKEILKDKPDYRDAYIHAASYAYMRGFFDEARTLIQQAGTLDPNATIVQKIQSSLENHE